MIPSTPVTNTPQGDTHWCEQIDARFQPLNLAHSAVENCICMDYAQCERIQVVFIRNPGTRHAPVPSGTHDVRTAARPWLITIFQKLRDIAMPHSFILTALIIPKSRTTQLPQQREILPKPRSPRLPILFTPDLKAGEFGRCLQFLTTPFQFFCLLQCIGRLPKVEPQFQCT